MNGFDNPDVLVVGSGPAGSAFARRVHDRDPSATVLMVDAGPVLTDPPGTNTINLRGNAHAEALALCRDDTADDDPMAPYLQPGTALLRRSSDNMDPQVDMPAASMSTNVGGMGAHWSCSCPRPFGSEVMPAVPRDEFDAAFEVAEDLLSITTDGFTRTSTQHDIEALVGKMVDTERQVQPMPLACTPTGTVPTWSGTSAILGDLLDESTRFTLRADTRCRRLLHENGRVRAAELEHVPTGRRSVVSPGAVVVACDVLRTPQLLWASGIRPTALGRYLNDQPLLVATVPIAAELVGEDFWDLRTGTTEPRDHLRGVSWVPFDDESHPYHGQIHYFDPRFTVTGERDEKTLAPFAVLSWFLPKEISPDNRVLFSDSEQDGFGMPAMAIRHRLSEVDWLRVDGATRVMRGIAEVIGAGEPPQPQLFPSGSSLHYQGTVRIGATDDGTSVCDSGGRVWGMDNLYVAGNGVIATSTACNPTATAVALAVIAADRVTADQ